MLQLSELPKYTEKLRHISKDIKGLSDLAAKLKQRITRLQALKKKDLEDEAASRQRALVHEQSLLAQPASDLKPSS